MEYIDIPIDMLDMKVDRDLMFRFFQNENTEEEAEMLGRWLKESGENENEFRKAYGSPKRSGKDCGGPKICVKLRHYYLNSSKRAVAFFISLIYKNHTDLRGNERIIRTPGTHPKPPASRRVRPRRVPPHGRIRTSRSCRPAAAPARRAGKGGTSTARYAAA